MTPKRTSEQAAETRDLLIEAGLALFGTQGFAQTKAAEVARRAGVTRGALLHHFADKAGLFAAVLELVETEVAATVVSSSATASDPLTLLRLGFDAFLEASTDPRVTQIMLIDGPSVLGWEAWYEIDSRYGFQPVVAAIRAAIDSGLTSPEDPELLAHLLLGALTEAATVIGRSENPQDTLVGMTDSFNRFLDRVLTPDRGLGGT
jgi:AcrR family transcriptional regulator